MPLAEESPELITLPSDMVMSKMISSSDAPFDSSKKSLQQAQELYSQIHTTIDEMDSKVEHVIKKHETEFLFAYRSHIKKIKKQLAEIKFKSEEQEKMFSSNDRIQYLEKELAIFREETMKLYRRLDQKNQELDLAKAKIKQLTKENSLQSGELKDFIRKGKFEEMNKTVLNQKIESLEGTIRQKDRKISQLSQINSSTHSMNKQDPKSKRSSIENLTLQKSEYSKTSPLKSPRNHSQLKAAYGSSINTSVNFYKQDPNGQVTGPGSVASRVYDSDLKSWFLECIKTVKREIAQRNSTEKSIELNNISGIEEFMMIDKLRLLEIFLANEKLLSWMYERIFPDRVSSLRQKLNGSKLESGGVKNVAQSLTERTLQKSSIQNNVLYASHQNEEEMNFSEKPNHRYEAQNITKVSYLPKVPRLADHKNRFNSKGQWKGNVILKGGKLNISMS